ncbi:retinol dehydrogenase 13-like [Diabrotica undecimpunctata]|uniref:retinol dehydrogenase 13-like n=1 Tax=Diabrotica undecimpunctata TaxID=50387 RepID=UPI003B632C48
MGIIFSAKCTSNNRLDGKTAIITGANTGIGKETAKDFYKRGAKVILACRNLEKASDAVADIQKQFKTESNLGHLKVVELDLCSLESVRACAKELLESEERIDLLINNAGVMMCPYGKTKDGFETQFGTNHLAHFLFTLLLLPKICKSTPARIINVSSIAHTAPYGSMDFTDLNFDKRKYNPIHAYQQSKLANILFTKELARRLAQNNLTDVNVYALHPGVIRTELSRHYDSMFPGLTWVYDNLFGMFLKTPTQGAQTQIYCAIDDKCAGETGLYYAECAVKPCTREAQNDEAARKLWDISMEFVGLDKNDDIFKNV